jgi:hypothetical protein
LEVEKPKFAEEEEKKKQRGEEERKIMMQKDKQKTETDELNKAKTDHPALPIWSISNHLRSQMSQYSEHLRCGLPLGAFVPVLSFLTNEQIAQKKIRIEEHKDIFGATFATAKDLQKIHSIYRMGMRKLSDGWRGSHTGPRRASIMNDVWFSGGAMI